MNLATKRFLLLGSLVVLAGNVQAAKTNPADCPCFEQMAQIIAETECMTDWQLRRFGHGKGSIKILEWQEGGRCGLIALNNGDPSITAFDGDTDVLAICDDDGATVQCHVDPLTKVQQKACEVALRQAKREVQRLPVCP